MSSGRLIRPHLHYACPMGRASGGEHSAGPALAWLSMKVELQRIRLESLV